MVTRGKRFARWAAAGVGAVTLAFMLPAWTGLQPQARAQQIVDVLTGTAVPGGEYLQSYFDVASSFSPSKSGYGGPGFSGGDGDALLRLVDAGNFEAAPIGTPVPGGLCANIYVFDDDQELQECCSCPLTADSEQTNSLITNLTANPAFSSPLSLGVIKIVTSTNLGQPPVNTTVETNCTSGGDGVAGTAGSLVSTVLANGMDAWLNHAESIASNQPPTFSFITSTSVEEFSVQALDPTELGAASTGTGLVGLCSELELHASGRGICKCGIGS